jgi:transcriptional regulator with XRE-family HTH domain
MAQTLELVEALKAALKAQGLTYAGVAARLGISEATVKRLFARGGFTLKRLEAVCALVNLDVSDLAELAMERAPLASALTPTQEEALVQDPKLLLVTFLVMSHWRFAEIVAAFDITEHEAVHLLAQLDRLGLIHLLPGNRIKLLTSRNFSWRKDGPVQAFFEKQVLPEFLQAALKAKDEGIRFVGGLLSEDSLEQFRRSIDKLARDFDELVEQDKRLSLARRHSCATLLAVRPWEFSQFARLKRGAPK